MKKDVIKKKIKKFVFESISGVWTGVVIGGGVALGFFSVVGILMH